MVGVQLRAMGIRKVAIDVATLGDLAGTLLANYVRRHDNQLKNCWSPSGDWCWWDSPARRRRRRLLFRVYRAKQAE